MMWHYGAAGWLWALPAMLIFWGLVIALAVLAFRAFERPHAQADAALDILRKRLAAGEISADEFERTRKLLQP